MKSDRWYEVAAVRLVSPRMYLVRFADLCLNVHRHSARLTCHSLIVLSIEEESKKLFCSG